MMKYASVLALVLVSVFVGCLRSPSTDRATAAATSETDVVTDSANVLVLTDPPVTKTGRKIQRGQGMVSLSDDYGNYVRVELLPIPRDIFAASRKEGGDNGLLRFLFDTMYFPATYGGLPYASEESRCFIRPDQKEILLVAINLPQGSVLSEDGKRLDAKRYVASFIHNPFCVYMTVEANTFSSDLSSINLLDEAKEKISKVKKALAITSEQPSRPVPE
jgi:hypothetical protein